ncbi:histone-like nucleoid-structuring protein Lsr2 [Streptosporangium sandarakinum]
MATRREEIIIDDLDGSPADETIVFAFGGGEYEIDLSAAHAEEFRRDMSRWLVAARPRRRKHRTRRHAGSPVWTDPNLVRAWAEANGIEVNNFGYPRREVQYAYLRALLDGKLGKDFM